jgi:hypothetical protein
MICPNCHYVNGEGWLDDGKWGEVKGKRGIFYKISNDVVMKRHETYVSNDVYKIYGCPNCKNIFMGGINEKVDREDFFKRNKI